MFSRKSRLLVLTGIAASMLALTLASCSSSSHTTGTQKTESGSRNLAPANTSQKPGSAPPASTVPTNPAASSRRPAAGAAISFIPLAIDVKPPQGGYQQVEIRLAVRNTGSVTGIVDTQGSSIGNRGHPTLTIAEGRQYELQPYGLPRGDDYSAFPIPPGFTICGTVAAPAATDVNWFILEGTIPQNTTLVSVQMPHDCLQRLPDISLPTIYKDDVCRSNNVSAAKPLPQELNVTNGGKTLGKITISQVVAQGGLTMVQAQVQNLQTLDPLETTGGEDYGISDNGIVAYGSQTGRLITDKACIGLHLGPSQSGSVNYCLSTGNAGANFGRLALIMLSWDSNYILIRP